MFLLEEVNFEINGRKGTKNQIIDHLSRLEDFYHELDLERVSG